MTFFVKPGMKTRFERLFNQVFGDCYELLTREQVMSIKLFGEGTPHPRTGGFTGDYLAVANGNVSIQFSNPTDDIFKAAHAGMTEDEIGVPFIVSECYI